MSIETRFKLLAVPSNATLDSKEGCILSRESALDEPETFATRLEEASICLLASMFAIVTDRTSENKI